MHIDNEPIPRPHPLKWNNPKIDYSGFFELTAPDQPLKISFSDSMARRYSGIGGMVDDSDLSDLLWHSSYCDPAEQAGRFDRTWYHSFPPAAAGLHSLGILCIPIQDQPISIYDRKAHRLSLLPNSEYARKENAANVRELTNAEHGSTLQFFADPNELESCYENSTSLLWRDSGALATAISFVAAASGLTSVVLGRIGTKIIRIAGLDVPYLGFGAIHIGMPRHPPNPKEGT